MTTPSNPRRDHSSTYFVPDRSYKNELNRLFVQDELLTAGMGGVLPEQSTPTDFQRVLDIGCGTGGWLIQVAQTYPTMARLVGIDINQRMVDYASSQAEKQQVHGRVEFRVMDALRLLEFPDEYLDLVSQRLGGSYLRTWDWPKLLQEFQRVTRPGGVIRVVESDVVGESSSPGLNRISQMLVEAFHQAGHFFAPEHNGLIRELPRLMHQSGLQHVQSQLCRLEFHAATPEGQNFIADMTHITHTMQPFLQKWSRVPDDYEALRQQALNEMQQPDFHATWSLLTTWGTRPAR